MYKTKTKTTFKQNKYEIHEKKSPRKILKFYVRKKIVEY